MELSKFWIDRLDSDARQIWQPWVAKDPNRLMGAKHALIDDPETPCMGEITGYGTWVLDYLTTSIAHDSRFSSTT